MSDDNKFSLIDLPDIPDSVDNALQNLTDVPTKNMGQTFGDLWYLVFGNISHAADKKKMKYAHDLEIYKQELNTAIEQIPENKKVEPSIQVTAQALENSKYCISSEALRTMFVKLITGTMDMDTEPLTHPSFPEMIKQMDETDALILMELKRNGDSAIACYKEYDIGKNTYHVLFANAYFSSFFNIPMNKSNSSLSLLERMGLVKLSYDSKFAVDIRYDSFRNNDLYHSFTNEIKRKNTNSRLEITKGICEITPLGRRFINVCVS